MKPYQLDRDIIMFLLGFTKTLNILTFLTFIPHILSMISGAPPRQVIYSLKPSWWNTIHKVYGLARLNRMAIICDSMVGVRHSAVSTNHWKRRFVLVSARHIGQLFLLTQLVFLVLNACTKGHFESVWFWYVYIVVYYTFFYFYVIRTPQTAWCMLMSCPSGVLRW